MNNLQKAAWIALVLALLTRAGVSLAIAEEDSLISPTVLPISQPTAPAAASPSPPVIYVDATFTDGDGLGNQSFPYRTITYALSTNPAPGTIIQLAPGTYNSGIGEQFPIKLPPGVVLRGDRAARGKGIVITGGGRFVSPTFAGQNVTLLPADGARIEGVTLTNANPRGYALWVESSRNVEIRNNTFTGSKHDGVFLTGTADAAIAENVFARNGANGLSAVGASTGEIRNNIFDNTGFGVAIGQRSRVTLRQNRITNNTDGTIVNNLATPTLRENFIANNRRSGIVILKDRQGYPIPDLGTDASPGKNVIRNNGQKDINNATGATLLAVGNDLGRSRLSGKFALTGMPSTTAIAAIPQTTAFQTATLQTVASTARSSEPTTSPIFAPDWLPGVPGQAIAPTRADVKPQTLLWTNSQSYTSVQATKTPEIVPYSITIDREPSVTPSVKSTVSAKSTPNAANAPTVTSFPQTTKPADVVDRYYAIVPSASPETLQKVKSIVPTARLSSSRLGTYIEVQGYRDRQAAESVNWYLRSRGLHSRVVFYTAIR